MGGENSNHTRPRLRNAAGGGGGEIVEVQGGHIVRSTGRKDRHSKVCTAKGPRDRRVRLAAHTAIQFYDVQDRLGYDRPSKAVDWLIKKAKSAIDELAQLPAWHPTNCPAPPNARLEQEDAQKELEEEQQQQLGRHHANLLISNANNNNNHNEQSSSFLPPSLDSDAIADTIKSFFPIAATAEANSSAMQQFHNFPTPDLPSRNGTNSQDLRLSLQSFQDPILLHQNPTHHSEQTHSQSQIQGQVLLSGIPLGFDGTATWQEHQFQRLAAWNAGGDAAGGSGGAAAGYLFNSPAAAAQLLGQQNQFLSSSQRGPLQSSNTPTIRAWMDPPSSMAISAADHHGQQQQYHHHLPIYPSSISGIGFAAGVGGGYSGFHIPARIQGDEEEHDGYPDKPSSASSDSRH